MYDLNFAVKSFAVSNEFVATMSKICYKLGSELRPFCLCADELQKQEGVLDLSTFGGMEDSSVTLLDEIASYRVKELQRSGVYVTELTSDMKVTLFFQYLMTASACYIEADKWKTTNGIKQHTYDKMLCTRNPAVMGAWMGVLPHEMQAKYSARIKADTAELNSGLVRYVKLNHSAKGNSVTQPRTFLNTRGMHCIPLFMLYAWVEGCKTRLKDSIVKFVFIKDNLTLREMCSTLSEDIIRKYYSDNVFINTMLSGVDIDTVEQGGMHISSMVHRGYIKIPELGSSVYDSTGTRSLNIARIVSAEVVDEIDTTYINVSLDSVVENFNGCVDYCEINMPSVVPDIAKKLGIEVSSDVISVVAESIKRWAYEQEILLSTSFRRYLHRFIIENPMWFPFYTGVKSSDVKPTMQNFGVAQMDF